ncbi:MAG TPA: hypothetical protein VND65_01820 [Candidatus Binatia bacterium]|nr:hypothetical protein [Candidatus Binatia bacterium]
MPEKMVQEKFPTQKWVCVSRTVPLKGGGTGVMFYELIEPTEEHGELGRERIYARKSFRAARAGGVYSIEATDTQCHPSTLRYIGPFPKHEDVDAWQAIDAARLAETERKRTLAKAASIPGIAQKLDPLRKICAKLNYAERESFFSVMKAYIVTGKLPR